MDEYIYVNIWDKDSLDPIIDLVSTHKNKVLIYDCSQESRTSDPHNVEKLTKIAELSLQNNINIFVILGSLDFYLYSYPQSFLNQVTIILNPTYWLYETFSNLKKKHFNQPVNNLTHLYCCFVNRSKARNHRCTFIDELYHTELYELGIHTWNQINPEYKFKHWNQTIIKSSDQYNSNYDDNWLLASNEYTNALMDIVLETSDYCAFYTEKTYKPIVLKKLFVIFGNPNINLNLQQLGFKLYDEIIDYSFDSITDNAERAHRLCLELKNLNNKFNGDYISIYNKVKSKLEYNHNNALKLKQMYPFKNLKKIYHDREKLVNFDYREVLNYGMTDTL